jgi:hypothetical protein
MSSAIAAVQHIRRLRGGSQSQLLRASDGHYYATKLMQNPQHIRVLANEMLATRLGELLGLPVPRVTAIEICDWLIEHSSELRIDLAGSQIVPKAGLHFGSAYAIDPAEPVLFDYLPEALLQQVTNLAAFGRALVLDKWTCNADGRQAVFTRSSKARNAWRAVFIDQGYCFNAGEWTFPDCPLRGVYAKNCVYAHVKGWDAFEPALTRAEEMDIGDIWRIAAEIPEEWYEFDRDGLSRLIETLHNRRSVIRDLITAFRTSSRNPFPLWTTV